MPTVPEDFVIRLFQRLNDDYPGVALYVKEAYSVNLVQWLQSGEVDLCFLYGPARAYQFQSTEMVSDEIVLLSPPGALEPGDSIHAQNLTNLPLAMPSRPFGPRLILDKLAASAGVQLSPKFAVDSFGIAVKMTFSGLAHTIMPISAVSEPAKEGKIELRRILPGPLERQLILCNSSIHPGTRASRIVLESAQEILMQMRADGSWRTSL